MLLGLNHLTITVSIIENSLNFYIDLLGFHGHVKWETGAYLSLGNLWFCLSLDRPTASTDYSHIAFDVAPKSFPAIKNRLVAHRIPSWKRNNSEGNSFYFLDPDRNRLEIHAGNLQSRLANLALKPYKNLECL